MDREWCDPMKTKPVAGVVLAAGPSSRFGDKPPKQLLEIEGEPLVRRIVRRTEASLLSSIVVVVGYRAEVVREAIADMSSMVVENPDFEAGQSTSVRAGLAALEARMEAAMFIPTDQPELSTALIDALLSHYWRTGGRIVVPVYRGQRGAPVVFDRHFFDELPKLPGDRGGRQLFAAHESEIAELPLSSSRPLEDIDSQADLSRYLSY